MRGRPAAVHRYYDPQTGQFLTADPLVDRTEQPYSYVAGDPIDSSDPIGLWGGQAVARSGSGFLLLLALFTGACASNPALCPHLPHLPNVHFAEKSDELNGKTISTETDLSDVNADVDNQGVWVSPEEDANLDAREIAEKYRGHGRDYESGRHGEGARRIANDLGRLIKDSEKAGKLPQYINRLKDIQRTYLNRARAGHPGGRRR